MKTNNIVLMLTSIVIPVLTLLNFLQPNSLVLAQSDMNWIRAVAWSPDGTKLATGNLNGTVQIWDANTGDLLHTLKEADGEFVVSVSWSPDGTKLASGGDGTLYVWDVDTEYLLLAPETFADDDAVSVAWSPDGSQLAVVSFAGLPNNFRILNSITGQEVRQMQSAVDMYDVDWNSTTNRIATAGSNTVQLWDPTISQYQTQLGEGDEMTSVSWNPDGSQVAGANNYRFRTWNTSNGQLIQTFIGHENYVGEIAWSPDGSKLASTSDDDTIRIWNATTAEMLDTIQIGSRALTVAWSPDGKRLAYGGEAGILQMYVIPAYRPSSLSAALLTSSETELSWVDNSSDETNFSIERSTTGTSDWSEIGTAVADSTTYTDSTVNPSTTYYYRVRAYRNSDDQYSEYSNVASILTVHAAPSGLGVVAGPSGRAYLSWQDNSSDETLFNVERSPNGVTWEEIGAVQTDVISLMDAGLEASTRYWYRVRAYRETDNQYSDYTLSVSVLTAPTGPSQVTAVLSAPNQIQISWADNSTDETEFRVERSTNATDWSPVGSVAAGVITFTDSSMNPSTTYYYRVRAYRSNDSVFSAYSQTSASVLSSPATPIGFAGVPLPINKAKLTWTDSTTDETNFRLERSDNGTSGWTEVATVAANQATYTETRTDCIQTSYYRIRAYRGSDSQYSAFSPVVSITTDGCGPDRLALFNTVHTHNRRFTEFPGTTYNDYWLNAPVGSGQWFMGDWNGDGVDTPAVFINGTYWYTNSQAASSTWTQINVQANEYPVVGRFDLSIGHDCLGVIDSILFPPTTVFMLGYTCNLTGDINPSLSYQWLGGILPDGQYTGEYQFVSGDWNGDGVDTIAARRSEYIAYTNVAPGQNAAFDQAQYFGNPYNGQYGGLYGVLVAGDWNYDGIDTFGYFYVDGNFYWRNHLEWNQPISGSALISNPYGTNVLPTTWRN